MYVFNARAGSSKGMGGESDERLLAAVARGDREAFEHIHRRYLPRLRCFALRLADDPQDCEEIVTASLLNVWRMAYRFHGGSKASVWIFGIVYRFWLDYQRRQEATRKEGLCGAEDVLDGSERMGGDFRGKGLDDVLRQLAPETRVVFELTYCDGYHYTEIAEILGCSEETVKARMVAVRRMLDRFPL